jgi:hypothetical protein
MSSTKNYNYYITKSLVPLNHFRVGQDPKTGRWHVFGSEGSISPIGEEIDNHSRRRLGECPIAINLSSENLAKVCVALAQAIKDIEEEMQPGIWVYFEQKVLNSSLTDTYKTNFPQRFHQERVTAMMSETLRDQPLEKFGNVYCCRRDVLTFDLVQEKATTVIYVFLKQAPTVARVCMSFAQGGEKEAQEELDDFVRRCNSQVMPHDIEFFQGSARSPMEVLIERQLREVRAFEGDPASPLKENGFKSDQDDEDEDKDDKVEKKEKKEEMTIEEKSPMVKGDIQFV